mmetsp:Transcript_35531/g.113537  ORF Transcript_35531/g.113537 Transcript_35531/m.113537 type:complete len:480 (-) Transcript_35531:97-1536(-)
MGPLLPEKYEAMLATGLPLVTVCEIAVKEGVAASTEEASALLSTADDERRGRRGSRVRELGESNTFSTVASGFSEKGEDPQNFFHALLQDTTTTRKAATPSSPKSDRGNGGETRSFRRVVVRKRRGTSAPPASRGGTSSPPLMEKLLRMQNEVPSRFKSEKRLQQTEPRPATKPLTLTIPESPQFAKKNSRPAKKEDQAQQATTTQQAATSFFKALALNPKIMRSSGDYGVPRVESAPTTSPKPFAFATEARRSRTARKPPPPSKDDLELAKVPTTKRKVSVVSRRLLLDPQKNTAAATPPSSLLFKARPAPKANAASFKVAPSSKPLTKPEAPRMPGLEIHNAARAKKKLRQEEEQQQQQRAASSSSRGTTSSSSRRPLGSATNELNSDRRARDRRAYDLAAAERSKLRDLERHAADAAVARAQHAELHRKKRTSIADGGLQFVARRASAPTIVVPAPALNNHPNNVLGDDTTTVPAK